MEDALWKVKAATRGKRRKKTGPNFDLPLEYDPRLIALVSKYAVIDQNSSLSAVTEAVVKYITESKLLYGCFVRVDSALESLLNEPLGTNIPIHSILSKLIQNGCISQKASS